MTEQKNKIFRKKSLDRISSPEQLTEYLKIANPEIWALLAAIVIMLAGLFAWSMAGRLETMADGYAIVKNGLAEITITDIDKNKISSGMIVRFGKDEYEISNVDTDNNGRIVAFAPVNKANGKYDVKIITESIHPIKFLFE